MEIWQLYYTSCECIYFLMTAHLHTSLHLLPTVYHVHQVAAATILTAKIISIAAYPGT